MCKNWNQNCSVSCKHEWHSWCYKNSTVKGNCMLTVQNVMIFGLGWPWKFKSYYCNHTVTYMLCIARFGWHQQKVKYKISQSEVTSYGTQRLKPRPSCTFLKTYNWETRNLGLRLLWSISMKVPMKCQNLMSSFTLDYLVRSNWKSNLKPYSFKT